MKAVQDIVEELARSGITTSFVYGPSFGHGTIWSVDALTKSGFLFEKPYAALDIAQAAEIAKRECELRGWLEEAI